MKRRKEMSKKLFLISLVMVLCIASQGFALDMGQVANGATNRDAGLILNPEGKGDLLVFPYYDVRPVNGKAQETLFLIINETTNLGTSQTGDQGIVAKLRFREWDKSEEVLDMDIWLSDADVWVGVVRINPLTGLGNLWSPDHVVVDFTSTYFIVQKILLGSGFDFITQNIVAKTRTAAPAYPPAGWTAAQMTHVGYFEVIGEERTATRITSGTLDRVARLEGYPECPNVLMGQAYLVRVTDGVAMAYNASAFANFETRFGIFVSPGALKPDLSDAQDGLDQLEFTMSKEDIFAAYEIDPALDARASVIITFPTKYFRYVNSGTRPRIATSDNAFRAPLANAGEVIYVSIWDRDENRITPEKSWWSPPPTIPPLSLPFEVNILGVYPGTSPSVTASPTSRDNVAIPAGVFKNGWIWIYLYDPTGVRKDAWPVNGRYFDFFGHAFGDRDATTAAAGIGYVGLPALGLQLQEFSNFAAGGYYGEINDIWYEVEWVNYNGYQGPTSP